jgi:transcriptional antiterminator RfaH
MTDEPLRLDDAPDVVALVDLTVPEDDAPLARASAAHAANDHALGPCDAERAEAELARGVAALGLRDLRPGPGADGAWYVVKCRVREERPVSVLLIGAGFDAFSPVCIGRRRIPGGVRQVAEALFPGYAFVRLSAQPEDWAAVRATPGVQGMVRFGAFAPRVPETAIAHIRGVDGLELDTPGGRGLRADFARLVIGESLAGLPNAFVQREGPARGALLVEFLRRLPKAAGTAVIASAR